MQYRQNVSLRQELFTTVGSVLVEASKYDRRWGIGSTKDDRMSWRYQSWQGDNWLGNILTETRDTLMKEVEFVLLMLIICVVFGRPYVKRFALCYRSVVCPVCLSFCVCPVCSVRALWPNGWMNQDEI